MYGANKPYSMGKNNKRGNGFSNSKPLASQIGARSKTSSSHIAKEQKALLLIKQGKLDEAEAIYRELVEAGSNNHEVYGKLGALFNIRGDSQNAIKFFTTAIKIKPSEPENHNNLGVALMELGKLTAAIGSYNNAIRLKPNYPDAHNNLGVALMRQGNLNAAIASYNIAIRLKPNYANAYFNIGAARQEEGDVTAAISSYNKAISLDPNYPEAYFNLGVAREKDGDLKAAIDSYKTAIKLNPNFVDAHKNLGGALKEIGELSEAIDSYKKALNLNPNCPDTYFNIGCTCKDQNDLKSALFYYKKSLEKDSNYSNAFYGIGLVQIANGDLKDSMHSLQKAIQLNPYNTAALFEQSRNIENDKEAKNLANDIYKVNRSGLDNKQVSMLEFALANCNHKLRNYPAASKNLFKANKLKLTYQPSDLMNHLSRAKQIIEASKNINTGQLIDGTGKIFIVGAPRCGSTILESVLATNQRIGALGETKALMKAMSLTIKNTGNQERTNSLLEIYTRYIQSQMHEYTHSVDKNLHNIWLIEAIARAMPAAKIIYCRRHPMDNILSMLRSNLKAGNNYTSDAAEAAKFLIYQQEEMKRFESEYGNHIYTFDYDSFTSQPNDILQSLISWLGFEWNQQYLQPERNKRQINTASVIQARQKINNRSVGGWKNYRELLKPAEEILGEYNLMDI